MNTRLLITYMYLLFSLISAAQLPTQKIKGDVIDADSHITLPGVNVYLLGSNPPVGTVTDTNGQFVLENVPVGRHTIQFSFMGYEPVVLNEVAVSSGKELELNVKMKESYTQLEEVVIKPEFRKDKAQNNMATLSARSFSVEEAMNYAGGWNDPSRLAGSFAGVTMAEGVNDNAIVIRGNAPKGLLWRLEGVEIPAPNHLNGVNNGGGIETVFSVNMLNNSDFFTGAFPAEYGNAISGVFDMSFRNGNTHNRETTFQIGTQGIDIGSEGPLKNEGNASYLFNYRYSTMGLVGQIAGGNFGLPEYQDLSFKFNLPTAKTGTFSIWGIGGLSSVAFDPDEDADTWENTFDNNKYKTGSDMAATGLSHKLNIKNKGYFKTALAFTYQTFNMKSDQLQRDNSIIPLADHQEENTSFTFNTSYNHKFNRKLTLKTGFKFSFLNFMLDIQGNSDPGISTSLISITNQDGSTQQFQYYNQWKWRLAPTFDFNAGLHLSHQEMSDEWVPEPRVGMSWRFRPKHAFHLAYGKHSRLEPIRFYFAQNDEGNRLNPHLKITKAHHFVMAYDFRINDNVKLKIEPYYQELFDVPVVAGTSESLLNYTWDMYFEEALVNKGTGTNIGVDFTLERYMKSGYYYMFTGSLFDSKYKGGDGIERNTSYNRNFVFNLLGGKEWNVKAKNVFSINGKIAFMGGNRFTPANQELSRINEMVVLDDDKTYDWQEDSKIFVDIAFNYRINKEKRSYVLALQAKNALMQSEMFGWAYDFEKQKVAEHGLTMMYPYFTYRIEF